MGPQLPIEVDEQTGVWTTDGLPMLYVPRHFFTNNHIAVESALGRNRYSEILYPAGYKSAYFWCEQESVTHKLSSMLVFEHYLNRLSQRGWGQFSFLEADPETGNAKIALRNSSFVLQQPGASGKLCYMFEGWFAGAMDWVGKNTSHSYATTSRETQCAAEGFDHCIFSITPKAA